MNTPHASKMFRLAAATAGASLLSLSSLVALAAGAPADAQARYDQERARCMAGQSGQAQETCLKEAGAALDLAKKGQLTDGGKYRKNAKDRCDALTGAEQRDCMARVKGASNTTTSGSVKGGGVIKETVTTEPAPAASSAR